jgi:Cu/Ag efflux protein CusF
MRKMVLVVALATLVAFASGLMAQAKSPEPATKIQKHRFSGVVEKVDQTANTVTVRGKVGGQEKVITFAINDKTKISSDGGVKKSFFDIKPGVRGAVDYFLPSESGKTGRNPVAVAVEYSSPKLGPIK